MADINMGMTEALRAEMANITSTQRAAVLMLLLGEEQAADIIKFLNPKEVQALGAAMVAAADFSQEAAGVAGISGAAGGGSDDHADFPDHLCGAEICRTV